MLQTLTKLVARLIVYPENMKRNMEITKGLYYSQSILLKLTERGIERKTAYEAVQRAAMKTWQGNRTLKENLLDEPEITAKLSPAEIEEFCSLDIHFAHVEESYRKVGL
jgi:adenylosuccinate lyase